MAGAFAASKGRYGYRRIKAMLRTGVSEKVIRRIMAEDGLVAHAPKRRRYSSYEGETTPAPDNLVNREFTAERPNEKWLTDISEIKARDGKVYLSPMIDCHDGKIVAYTAGFSPNAELANRMLVKAAERVKGQKVCPESRIFTEGTLRHLYGAAAQSSQPHHPYRGAAQPVLGIHRTVCYTTLAWLRCTIREPGFAGILEPEFSKRCQGWYPLRAGAGLVRLERNGL